MDGVCAARRGGAAVLVRLPARPGHVDLSDGPRNQHGDHRRAADAAQRGVRARGAAAAETIGGALRRRFKILETLPRNRRSKNQENSFLERVSSDLLVFYKELAN